MSDLVLRGRPSASPDLEILIIRGLTDEDMDGLRSEAAVFEPGPPRTLQNIRASHHSLAMLLAKGIRPADAALMSGYSPGRISSLQKDPAFAELLAHYQAAGGIAHTDIMERLKILGMHALDELQAKLEETPEEFSKRDLMEILELGLLKGRQGPGGQGAPQGGAGGVVVNVKFVGASAPQGPIIDQELG